MLLWYATAREEVIRFVPADLREKVARETCEGSGYRYMLRNIMLGVWGLRIELASDSRLTEEAVWVLDSAHELSGQSVSFKPVEASEPEVQERIDTLDPRLHWSVAIR